MSSVALAAFLHRVQPAAYCCPPAASDGEPLCFFSLP